MFKGHRQLSIHGASPDVLRSMLQKAIRRADEEVAVAAAMELAASGCVNGVFERLIHVCDEDVGYHGLATRVDVMLIHERCEMAAAGMKKTLAKMAGDEATMRSVVEAVLICCRTPHTHIAAWVNMLSNVWDVPDEDWVRGETVMDVWVTSFRHALDQKKLKSALAFASVIDIVCRVKVDKALAKEVKIPEMDSSSTEGTVYGLSRKFQKTRMAEVWDRLHAVVLWDNDFRRLSQNATRLSLMNAVLRSILPEKSPAPKITMEEKTRLAAAFPPAFFSGITSETVFLESRALIPRFPDWAADKHCSLRHREIRPMLDKMLEEHNLELSEEEKNRTHPMRSAFLPSTFTLEHFLREGTHMENQHPAEAMFREEAIAAYLKQYADSGGTKMRAQHRFAARVAEMTAKAQKFLRPAEKSKKRPREENE